MRGELSFVRSKLPVLVSVLAGAIPEGTLGAPRHDGAGAGSPGSRPEAAQLGAASRASQERIEADSLEIAKATKSFTTVWTFVAVGLAGILVAIAILTYLHIQPH